jgi:hypothetical protein
MAVRQLVESGWLSPRRAGAVVVVAAAGGSWRLAAARVGIVWRCLRWRMAQGADFELRLQRPTRVFKCSAGAARGGALWDLNL